MVASLLICTDLDRTLIPNGPQPESPDARKMLVRLVSDSRVHLCYVSGRSRCLVEQALDSFDLPIPDFVVGDVGTTLYRVGPERTWEPDREWLAALDDDWGGMRAVELADAVGEIGGLEIQPPEGQNRHKLSYYAATGVDRDVITRQIREDLDVRAIRARLVWSTEEGTTGRDDRGLLDIIPACASKYEAIRALMTRHDFSLGETVFCGDSGNDLEVLASPIRSVLVANASEAVRSEACHLAEQGGWRDRLYLAGGGFAGMNGNYAAGMLEGIAHFYPETVAWMRPPRAGAL